MRISSSTIYESNVAALNQQQTQLLHTQQQVATGRRILTPADDPAGAARALEVAQSDATNTQYAANRNEAKHLVSLSEGTLQSVTTLLQDVRTSAIQAGNGALTAADRQVLATDLRGRLDELLGLANSTDGTGNYLFSGFQGKTQPFVLDTAGFQYMADDGQRLIQVGSTRQMPATDSGADIFMRIRNGNGTFATQAAAANTGSGVIGQGDLASPPPTAAQLGNHYTLTFSVTGSVTTYSVTGADALGAPLPTAGQPSPPLLLPVAAPYASGQAISFNGIRFDISGSPANGDTFTVAPSTNESIFQTISDLVSALNGGGSAAQLTNSLGRALNGLERGLENVLTVRASLGSRLRELDALQITGEDMGLQFKQTLSQLQDVDYNRAISDLNQQQIILQASQKSFKLVSDMSLFNYL
ncbi:MAG: flagellar hook-associated protein FlgL [Nitrosomonadales bacterium]|nr:flagellar hook-associated protein FlgL [Nitrosomonadales bacterium]